MDKELCLVGCNQLDHLSMYCVYRESGLKKYAFRENNYGQMGQGRCVEVSSARFCSHSWVGHHQGQTSEGRGGGAKNWRVGEGMEILKKGSGVPGSCGNVF